MPRAVFPMLASCYACSCTTSAAEFGQPCYSPTCICRTFSTHLKVINPDPVTRSSSAASAPISPVSMHSSTTSSRRTGRVSFASPASNKLAAVTMPELPPSSALQLDNGDEEELGPIPVDPLSVSHHLDCQLEVLLHTNVKIPWRMLVPEHLWQPLKPPEIARQNCLYELIQAHAELVGDLLCLQKVWLPCIEQGAVPSQEGCFSLSAARVDFVPPPLATISELGSQAVRADVVQSTQKVLQPCIDAAQSLLHALRLRLVESNGVVSGVGDVLLAIMAQGFPQKLSGYVESYEPIKAKLDLAKQRDAHLAAYLAAPSSWPGPRRLDIDSYLHRPVNIITRLVLLGKALSKETDDNAERDLLNQAVDRANSFVLWQQDHIVAPAEARARAYVWSRKLVWPPEPSIGENNLRATLGLEPADRGVLYECAIYRKTDSPLGNKVEALKLLLTDQCFIILRRKLYAFAPDPENPPGDDSCDGWETEERVRLPDLRRGVHDASGNGY